MKESLGRVAAFLSLCAVAQGYTFDDIRFWVGEGTNRAAVVLDWGHDDGTPAVRVWGYRWNGNATAAQALLAIDEADPNLEMEATAGVGMIKGFTYDAGGETYDAGSEDDYGDTYMYGTYWSLSSAEAGGEMQYSNYGVAQLPLVPGGRVGMRWTYYSFDFVTYEYDPGDTSIAEDDAVAATAPAFTFDDIHYWVGEGTNRVAVVIDFNRNGYAPRVWGYRWDGTAPAMAAVIAAIAEEDNRLHYLSSQGSWGTSVDGFGYDLPDRAVTFQDDLSKATDVTALFGAYAGELYWAQALGTGPDFASVQWTYGSGVDYDIPTDGGWYSFRLTNWMTGESPYPSPSDCPLPAETPYGWKVVSASTETASAMYGDPSVVLGRPLDYMKGQWGGPVSPYNPAWTDGSIYTLENGVESNAHVTIAFDHRVYDDPANPYGLDFLVFGNSLFSGSTTDDYSETTDPASVSFATSGGGDEPGLVEVSQDGTTWYAYASGPYADTAFPTLGRLYDTATPDASLFTGNLWWGRCADATLPVDPAIRRSDIGTAPARTLADLCIAYNGSAGGTGFDLADFPNLPADETGRKWIRFVRIKPAPTGEFDDDGDPTYHTPEIDAVADVAPRPSYENWVRSNYSWKTVLTAPESRAKDAVAANGRSNAENAALGFTPDEVSSAVLRISGFEPDFENGVARIRVPGVDRIDDLVLVASATNLAAATANWSVEQPVYLGRNEDGENVFEVPLADTDAARFYRAIVK